MKPARFEYRRAESLEGALETLAEEGEEAKVLAGGQSLVALMNMRLARPEILLDINRIGELRGFERHGTELVVGALTTQADLEYESTVAQDCPLLAEAIPYIGHTAIRNRGTIGGTVAHADPAAEVPVVLAALGGSVTLRSSTGERSVPCDDFFLGFLTTATAEEELLTSVRFPVTGAGSGTAFEEFARRPGDFALASVACVVDLSDGVIESARVALGGMASTPLVLDGMGELIGLGAERAIERAVELTREVVDPPADIHGSSDYRRHLVGELIRRAFRRALEQ